MERVVHIAKSHEEAQRWNIKQAIEMTVEERQKAAAVLKRRVYGDSPDVRAYYKNKQR
jgi:predicted transcriptional regulator